MRSNRSVKAKNPTWVFWLTMTAMVVLICFAILEVTARLLVHNASGIMTFHGISYRHYPGYRTFIPDTRFERTNETGAPITVDLDEMGLRNPPHSLTRASVMVLGDSMIAAENTPVQHTLVGELRAVGINAYNAGVDGVSTFSEVELLRDHLRMWRGRIVVLAFYLGNDFRDNYGEQLIPEASGTAQTAAPAGSGVSMGDAARSTCRALASCVWLYQQVYLGLIKGEWHDPMASYALAEMEMLGRPSAAADAAVAKTRQAFAELARIAKQRGFAVLCLGIPSEAQVLGRLREISAFDRDPRSHDYALDLIRSGKLDFDQPDRLAAALAGEVGFRYLSLLPVFRARAQEPLFYQIDHHWTSVGQNLAAETVAPHLREMLAKSASAVH